MNLQHLKWDVFHEETGFRVSATDLACPIYMSLTCTHAPIVVRISKLISVLIDGNWNMT